MKNFSEAKRHDRTVACRFNLQPGSVVAFDRAYNDYTLVNQWTDNSIFFITRQKENAVYEIIDQSFSDQIIHLTGQGGEEKCPHLLR